MADIDAQTLLMAVQAVQAQLHALETKIDQAGEDDEVSEQEDLLTGYLRAAGIMRVAYEAEELISSNLPPYDRLVPVQDRR
jgi:predicted transcriptional regulator